VDAFIPVGIVAQFLREHGINPAKVRLTLTFADDATLAKAATLFTRSLPPPFPGGRPIIATLAMPMPVRLVTIDEGASVKLK